MRNLPTPIYTHIDLFAGIGGFSLAFERAGFETLAQVEIDDFCNRVLEKHWPDTYRQRNIFDCGGHNLPYADVITAGFPCQPFSVAGSRRGSQDERFLWPELIRVIAEIRPRIVLLENVPGILSIEHGNTFRRILQDLASAGYDAEWACIPASAAGAAHRRERWWCVAYRDGTRQLQPKGHERQFGGWPDHGSTPMAYRNSQRQSEPSTLPNATPDTQRHISPFERTGTAEFHATVAGGQDVVNADGAGSQEQQPPRVACDAGHTAGQSDSQWGNRSTQSILGRAAARLSAGVDCAYPVARPGEPQYPHEPPRTANSVPQRSARIKALGNAVYVPLVYVLAEAIREALETEDRLQEGR